MNTSDPTNNPIQKLVGRYSSSRNHELNWGAGTLTLVFSKTGLLVSNKHLDSNIPEFQKHFAATEEISEVELSPCLPSEAVLVHSSVTTTLIAHASVNFYLAIPIYIKVTAITQHERIIVAELPLSFIKPAWYGDYASGETVVYQKVTSFSDAALDNINFAICEVQLTNITSGDLNINKICIQTEYLALYQKDFNFFATPLTITHKGGSEPSMIKVSATMPHGCTLQDRIAAARSDFKGFARLRSLGRFLEFTGLKFLAE